MDALPFHQQILLNNINYTYYIQPFVLKNVLGFPIALMDEYIIWDLSANHFKLYRTPDGNWYDMEGENFGKSGAVISALKVAIEEREG
jgi:hypothetical protein